MIERRTLDSRTDAYKRRLAIALHDMEHYVEHLAADETDAAWALAQKYAVAVRDLENAWNRRARTNG